jgi:hypothetical protein
MKQAAIIIGSKYSICIDGTLINLSNNKVKKWTKDTNGYMKTQIWNNGKPKNISQHRILAEYFIENPFNKQQVNHKNGIKYDNRIDNLEWVTQSENSIHSFDNGLQKPTRPHMKMVINMESQKIYECISDAAKDIGVSVGHLNLMLNKKKNNTTKLKFYETDNGNRMVNRPINT